jgi:hypothetical protein
VPIVEFLHHNINFPNHTCHVTLTITCLHCRIFNSFKKKNSTHTKSHEIFGRKHNNKREWLKEQKNLTVPTLFSVQSATLYPRPPSNVCSVLFTKFQPTNQIAAVTAFLILPPFHVTSTISLSLSLFSVSLSAAPYRIRYSNKVKRSILIGLDWIGSQKAIYILPFFSPQVYI